jgi:hypothetical protein
MQNFFRSPIEGWQPSISNSRKISLRNQRTMKRLPMGVALMSKTDNEFSCCRPAALRIGKKSNAALVNERQRHLMNDLAALLPHAKKDAKLDTKSKLYYLNELADLYNCNNVLFFESRKHGQDLYLWLSKAPNGPSMKFHLQNCIFF